jgi:hypothetical protein
MLRRIWKSFRSTMKRREARTHGEWDLAPFEHLLAEARLRVAMLPPTPAARRLTRRVISDEAELLELLRGVRVQVCAEFAGLARYDASGMHAILLALRQRHLRREASAPGRTEGVFR